MKKLIFILLRRIPRGLAAGMSSLRSRSGFFGGVGKAKGEPCEVFLDCEASAKQSAKHGMGLRKNENREIPRGSPRGAQMSFIVAFGAIGLMAYALTNSRPVSAWNVNIDTNLSVSTSVISFATVFPEEIHFKPLVVSLSQAFLNSPIHDDVEYKISQKPKPRLDSNRERNYCREHPTDFRRCYPSLCPYLSKEPDGTPANDIGVPAFHDPSATTSIARGRLVKSDEDTSDEWTIDLHVPCFKGQCDQQNDVPPEYRLDPSLNGQVFGCDLVVEVKRVSFFIEAPTRTYGFWKNHTDFTSRIFQDLQGGSMDVGSGSHVRTITNLSGNQQSRLFGAYFASVSKKTNNSNRTNLDQARMRLLRQLVTTKLNCAAFGCSMAIQDLITAADNAYAIGTAAAMDALKTQLDIYNNSGGSLPIPPALLPIGSSTPAVSESQADKVFWDNP